MNTQKTIQKPHQQSASTNGGVPPNHLQIRSDFMNDIIGNPPGWPIRWGNILILILLIKLLILSSIIKYPDKVQARVTITTRPAPIRIVTKISGNIAQLLAGDKQPVNKNDHLAVIDNPASYKDVLTLLNWTIITDRLIKRNKAYIPHAGLPDELVLGMIQDSYINLQTALANYASYISNDYRSAKLKTLEQQLNEYTRLNTILLAQKENALEELKIAEKKYNRDKLLFKKQILSKSQYEQSQQAFINQKYTSKSIDNSLSTNRIQRSQTQITIIDLKKQHVEHQKNLRLSFRESYHNLKKQINAWKARYLLHTPISGQVSFFSNIHENQFVQSGTEIMAIIPGSQKLHGEAFLKQAGMGKVKVGQKARVILDSYPPQEFGAVSGSIDDISLLTRDKSYLIQMSFPEGLKTSYGIHLNFRQEMEGNLEIITEDFRLIERVFAWIKYAIYNN